MKEMDLDMGTGNLRSTSLHDSPVASHNRRRWLRISVRTILVLVAVLAIWRGMSRLGERITHARRQQAAIATLKKTGANFYYAHQRQSAFPGHFDPSREIPAPLWLGNLVGYEFFRTVIYAGLRRPSDQDLQQLAGLPHLEGLYLGGDYNHKLNISDVGLAHLPRPD